MNDEKLLAEFPELDTVRLKLRKLSDEDAYDIFEYSCVQETARFLIWEPHTSIIDSLEFISFADQQFKDNCSIIWGIELKEERKLVGTIDLRG
ncbi:MAG: GNAT family N-acetyltransferase, partial [Bacteroidota bacterium]